MKLTTNPIGQVIAVRAIYSQRVICIEIKLTINIIIPAEAIAIAHGSGSPLMKNNAMATIFRITRAAFPKFRRSLLSGFQLISITDIILKN